MKILTLKNWSVRLNETTHGDQLILVDPVDDEEAPGPRTRVGFNLTMRDLNKWKNINTHPIDRSSLSYFTLAWQSNT